MDFIRRIDPDVSVWYHQPWGAVLACRGRPAIAARYAKLVRMGTSCRGNGLPGNGDLVDERQARGRRVRGRAQGRLHQRAGRQAPRPRGRDRRGGRLMGWSGWSAVFLAVGAVAAGSATDGTVPAPATADAGEAAAAAAKPRDRQAPDPLPPEPQERHGGLLQAPLRRIQVAADGPEADRHPLRGRRQHRHDLQHLRSQPARRRVRGIARRLLAVRRRRQGRGGRASSPTPCAAATSSASTTSRSGSSTSASATPRCWAASRSCAARWR